MGRYIDDRNVVMLIKEATAGTFLTPTVALPLERGNGLWDIAVDKVEINPLSPHLGSKETIVLTDFAQVDMSAKLKLPTNHLLIAEALEGCGVVSTVIANGFSYAYDSSVKSTVSLQQVSSRVTTKAYGERGDFSLVCEVGKPVDIDFSFKGLLQEQVRLASVDNDNVLVDTPSFESVYMSKNCTAYLVNGNEAHFTKVELKLNADIAVPKDSCPGESWTKDIKPELLISIMDDIDNAQSFDDLKNGTAFNFVVPFFDIAGTKKWELVVPNCVVIEHKTPVDEGRIAIERTFECRKVNGDDNFELKWFT